MGRVATLLDLRLEEGAGRLEARPIMLLLDREADEFIARRSGADAWLTKPLQIAGHPSDRLQPGGRLLRV